MTHVLQITTFEIPPHTMKFSIPVKSTRTRWKLSYYLPGSMRQLNNNSNETRSIADNKRRYSLVTWIDSTKRSQTSLNVINACNTSLNSQPSDGIRVSLSAQFALVSNIKCDIHHNYLFIVRHTQVFSLSTLC